MSIKIALLAGGFSGEYDISVQSARNIEKQISHDGHDVYFIEISKDGWFCIQGEKKYAVDKNDFSILIDGNKITFDLAFIAIHGTPGEDGKLQSYFEMLNIPYTGCNSVVSSLAFNKYFCNQVVAHLNIVRVARSVNLQKKKDYTPAEILKRVSLPVFVKPCEGGSSLATFKVKTEQELMPAITKAFEADHQVLVEEFIQGREFSVGVYTKDESIQALPVTELISTKEFFDYEAKYTPGITNEVTPAEIDPMQTKQIRDTAVKIYEALNCRGLVRIDFIMDTDKDHLFFLEVNTVPGQSDASIVPQQLRVAGIPLREFYDSMIDQSL